MILVLAFLSFAILVAYFGHRTPIERPEYRPVAWRVSDPPSNVTLPWGKHRPFRLARGRP